MKKLIFIIFLINTCTSNNSLENKSRHPSSVLLKRSCHSIIQAFAAPIIRSFFTYERSIFRRYSDFPYLARNYSRDAVLNKALNIIEEELHDIGIVETNRSPVVSSWVDNSLFMGIGIDITPEMLKKKSYTSSKALLHPDFKKYLKNLNSRGYRVVINPSLAVTRHFGLVLEKNKTLSILPNTPWEIFLHEYEHTLFNDISGSLGFSTLRYKVNHLKKKEMKKVLIKNYGYSSPQASEFIRLMKKKSFTDVTINESLAVNKEINTLYKSGVMPWSFVVYQARAYRWRFQLMDLKELRQANQGLGLMDNLTYWSIHLKQIMLHPIIIAGSITIIAIYFSDDLEKVFLETKNGTIF